MSRLIQINDALKAELELILIANNYNTDIGTKVHMGRVQIDDDMMPCISVFQDTDNKINESNSRKQKATYQAQSYLITAHLACDPDNPNLAANLAIADLQKGVFNSLYDKLTAPRDGLAKDVSYTGSVIVPRADGAAFVSLGIYIVVNYALNLTEP